MSLLQDEEDIARGLGLTLTKILTKLKAANVIGSFALETGNGALDEDAKDCLVEAGALLGQCLDKLESIPVKPVDARKESVVSSPEEDEAQQTKAPAVEGSQKGEDRFPCPVEGCERIFRRVRTMKKHARLDHRKGSEGLTCPTCGKGFRERGKLNRHALSHERARCVCDKCGRAFYRADNLRRHAAVAHGNRGQAFLCGKCGKSFTFAFNRDVHEKNVHGTERIRCEVCGEESKNRATYKEHVKRHEGKPLPCSLCPKTFLRRSRYRSHLKSKHKDRSPFQKLFDTFAEGDADI